MFTFETAKQYLAKARNQSKGRPIANNTRLISHGNGYGVKLHNTVVVAINRDGTFTLDNGGWFTRTTLDRINSYAPVRIVQRNHVWYVAGINGDILGLYFNGMRVDRNGHCVNPELATQRLIEDYFVVPLT